VTREKVLWVDGWSTPAWVKARFEPMTQGRLQLHADHDAKDSEDIVQGNRYWHEHVTLGIKLSSFLNGKR